MSTNVVFFQLVASHYKYVSLSYSINDMASMLLEHLSFISNRNWRVETLCLKGNQFKCALFLPLQLQYTTWYINEENETNAVRLLIAV